MTPKLAVWAAVLLIGLLPPLYILYLLEVKGPADSLFDREKVLAKFNRRWRFYVINEKVAIRFTIQDE